MKKCNVLWAPLLAAFLITACGGGDKGKSKSAESSTTSTAQANRAAGPILAHVSSYEGASEQNGVTVSYKICQVNQPGYDATLKFLYNKDKRQIEYDAQKEAEALEAGKPFKNTWSLVRSTALVDVCPAGANGRCELSNFIRSYYTDSPKLLAQYKKACALLPDNIWTDNP